MRRFGGTGLGLTICRRLATAMGGCLMVQSDGLGMGATFEFVIPLLRAPRRRSSTAALVNPETPLHLIVPTPPRMAAASDCDSRGPSFDGRDALPDAFPAPAPVRVLIAEDDRLCQTLMRHLMPKMGFTATLVDNGAAAIDTCCELLPATGGASCAACCCAWCTH